MYKIWLPPANDEFAYTMILTKGIYLIVQLSLLHTQNLNSVHVNPSLYMYPIILLVQLRNPYLIYRGISSFPFIAYGLGVYWLVKQNSLEEHEKWILHPVIIKGNATKLWFYVKKKQKKNMFSHTHIFFPFLLLWKLFQNLKKTLVHRENPDLWWYWVYSIFNILVLKWWEWVVDPYYF